eukprot:scaffold1379_cov390-Prasinococcus_capsulatus_cf.AAC.7
MSAGLELEVGVYGEPKHSRHRDVPVKLVVGSQAVIGFGGSVAEGLLITPDGKLLIYPLGCTIVLSVFHVLTSAAAATVQTSARSAKARVSAGPRGYRIMPGTESERDFPRVRAGHIHGLCCRYATASDIEVGRLLRAICYVCTD